MMEFWIYIALAFMAGIATIILIDLLFLRPSYEKQIKHLRHENERLKKEMEHWKASSKRWFDTAWDFTFQNFEKRD